MTNEEKLNAAPSHELFGIATYERDKPKDLTLRAVAVTREQAEKEAMDIAKYMLTNYSIQVVQFSRYCVDGKPVVRSIIKHYE